MKTARSVFRMPTVMKITGRSSSITNAFINALIPAISPTETDIEEALSILGMTPETVACAYCGDAMTEWDHLRPLVMKQRPTGYISEIQNLVPACGKCNQSKGNKYWQDWISSSATLSPANRRKIDVDRRIQRLEAYEQWRAPTHIDFETVIGVELWDAHWKNWDAVLKTMQEAQAHAENLRIKLGEALSN